MTEQISNKELAESLYEYRDQPWRLNFYDGAKDKLLIAAARLAAMPDAGEPQDKLYIECANPDCFTKMSNDMANCCLCKRCGDEYEKYHASKHTQPQQPAPDRCKETEKVVRNLLFCTHTDDKTGFYDLLRGFQMLGRGEDEEAKGYFEQAKTLQEQYRSAPDKETIKRYCLEFLSLWDENPYGDEDERFEKFWQQQSAEGGE